MSDSKRVLHLGSFDIIHYGHLRALKRSSQLGDLTVGLGSDSYQASYKRVCINSYDERAAALAELPFVDEIAVRSETSIKGLLDVVKPDYLVTGSEWHGSDYLVLSGIDMDYLVQRLITLVYIPREHDMSTTEIIRRVEESVS
jgi:glycerol-3-phosphate cytidylyltransferase